VVSRALGRPCVVGCGDTVMQLAGQLVTVDGEGQVWAGVLPMVVPAPGDNAHLAQILAWADELGETKFMAKPDSAALAALEADLG
jgi:pyruvate, orthophosphate dikinase